MPSFPHHPTPSRDLEKKSPEKLLNFSFSIELFSLLNFHPPSHTILNIESHYSGVCNCSPFETKPNKDLSPRCHTQAFAGALECAQR